MVNELSVKPYLRREFLTNNRSLRVLITSVQIIVLEVKQYMQFVHKAIHTCFFFLMHAHIRECMYIFFIIIIYLFIFF